MEIPADTSVKMDMAALILKQQENIAELKQHYQSMNALINNIDKTANSFQTITNTNQLEAGGKKSRRKRHRRRHRRRTKKY